MTFFRDIKGQGEFKTKAMNSLKGATHVVDMELNAMLEPYYDFEAHLKSVLPPFFRLTQLVRNVTRFGYGACVFAGALVTGNITNAVGVLKGMLQLVLAAAVEVINIVISALSFIARTLSTIVNLGYISFWGKYKGHRNTGPIASALDEFLSDPYVQDAMDNVLNENPNIFLRRPNRKSSDQIADSRKASDYLDYEVSIQTAALRLV